MIGTARRQSACLLGEDAADLAVAAQVVGVAPDLGHHARLDPEREGRREHLLDPGCGQIEEEVLHAPVRGADDDLVALGDHVVDGPPLLDRPDVLEQRADPVVPGRQVGRPAVHLPVGHGRRQHGLYVVVADLLNPAGGQQLVGRQVVARLGLVVEVVVEDAS